MSDDSEHWSIVEELERKTLESIERIHGQHFGGQITQAEAIAAYNATYWMAAGLIRDRELLELIQDQIKTLGEPVRSGVMGSGKSFVSFVTKGDHYFLYKGEPKKQGKVEDSYIGNGYGGLREQLLALGFEDLAP